MKLRFICAVFLLSTLVSGCGGSSGGTESEKNSTGGTTGATENTIVQSKKWREYLKDEIIEFSVSKSDCGYDDGTLELLAKFVNITSRDILAIEADAEVQDLFGEKIMGLSLSSDELLTSGQTVNVGSWGSSCWGLNNYNSDELRLMNMTKVTELTKIIIQVNKIAFKDGEILEF